MAAVPKTMNLRRPGVCCVCRSAVSAGSTAQWNSERRTVTCLPCVSDPSRPVVAGEAGASAMQEAERRRQAQRKAQAKYRDDHPVLSRVQAVFGPPPKDAGRNWEVGAVGEQRVKRYLDTLGDAILTLHDLRIPSSRANIDHLAITPTGVWVLDPKLYTGRIERRDVGGWLKTDERLFVKGADRTKLIDGVNRQMKHVSDSLDLGQFADVPVGGAVWFVDPDVGWLAKPFMLRGVAVTWGRKMGEVLTREGPLSAERRATAQRHLAEAFPHAGGTGI